MPLNMPGIFPQNRETFINYDWTNIGSATGYISYQGFMSKISSGDTYSLAPYDVVSSLTSDQAVKRTEASTTLSGATKIMDLDFDLSEQQIPQVLRGKSLFLINWTGIQSGVGGNGSSYVIVKIRKWDGASETEIGSVQSAALTTGAGITNYNAVMLPIDVTGTLIKQGENIRVTVEMWASVSAGTITIYLKHDPYNTDNESRMVANLAYKIEV